ncbi:cryptochrome/photolyase family protein [Spiribacter onubensis]|uniref:Cryptochrome/photolyase family protein n=1 Tax=Spiribacter onubensis TaxID=3122420 RepID=A0ABV3S8K4_9GAMM
MSAGQRLIVVLGDQLDRRGPLLDGLDAARDTVWMTEAVAEAERGPVHQQRLVLFFSAMRHLRDELRARGINVRYRCIEDAPVGSSDQGLADHLRADIAHLQPDTVVMMEAGDWGIEHGLQDAVRASGATLDWRRDSHFLASRESFACWAAGRKSLTLEYFYRSMRKRHAVLMEGDQPAGGAWNFDKDNRAAFGRDGPGELPPHPRFQPDTTTREVIDRVLERYGDHPGDARDFDQPVTPDQAQRALDDFIRYRLPRFGTWQDAIWVGDPLLYHARLSTSLNLHLLDPRDCLERAEAAYHRGEAPLNAVEGFVRQILGWREFIRGIYWLKMPDYAEGNALDHHERLPSFYWDGETEMACVADAMAAVLRHGYAHHIQRLMVLGLFAQLYGAHPYAFHEWHMALYLDAVDWVSLPNALGMSQFGDGGVVGTKPYCASGAYISRMSNACGQCRYDPGQATGERACPFTTFYWEFLDRHEERLGHNRRLQFQYRNLHRKSKAQRAAIREQAMRLREQLAADSGSGGRG